MLLRSFAHWLLVAFSLIFLATAVIVAAELGFLGESMHSLIDALWHAFHELYEPQRSILDPAIKWIGFAGTALGAVWTVHKGWHYAEQNLPKRLKEYNERQRAHTLERRKTIPALVRVISIAPPPFVEPGPLGKLIRRIYDPERTKLDRYDQELSVCKSEFEVLNSTRVRRRAEVITAHLLKGSQLTHVAQSSGNDALDCFNKALSFNRSDLDALELAAKQSFALNLRSKAREHLTALAEAASNIANPIRHARALRFHAETLETAERADRELARGLLVEAISELNSADIRNADARDFELGLAYLQLAEVQILRERFFAARAALNAARRLLQGSSLSAVMKRLTDTDDRLKGEERDPDNPDITD